MLDEHFIKQGDLSQELVQQGVIGRIAGFNVFESNNMDYESTTRVASKKTTTEFIAGHPNWCHRVMEWQTPVHLQDLSGSGKYIGASAVQGRKVYGLKVSKPQTLYIKRTDGCHLMSAAMLYAEVQDVEAGFRALSRDEQTQCAALLAEAAVIIDSYNPDAGKDAKRVVSCRMVRRQLGESDSGGGVSFPVGSTQGTATALGYSQSWTMSGGSFRRAVSF